MHKYGHSHTNLLKPVALVVVIAFGSSAQWLPRKALAAPPASTSSRNVCVTAGFCLCVTEGLRDKIEKKAKHFRDLIHSAHAQHQIAIYLSVPLSSGQGGYFPLNREIAASVAEKIAQRLGESRTWVLDPAVPDADLPTGATQADYLYMWAMVLYGAEQTNDGVDSIYFLGPEDVGRFFGLDGRDDLSRLARYFHRRVDFDPDFAHAVSDGKIDESKFTTHYGFQASVAFSVGSHDEWNLVQLINARRRLNGGVTRQVPILFDGHPVPPPLYETPVSAGNVGSCH